MGELNRSLRQWLEAYARGQHVPQSILLQLKDSSLISHRDWVDAWNRRARFTAPLEHIFERLEYLETRVTILEREKGGTECRPIVRATRRIISRRD